MTDALPIPAELMPEPENRSVVDAVLEAFDQAEAPASVVTEALSDEPPEQRRWRIEDMNGAEWAMRKLAEAGGQLHALTLQRAEWIDKIETWHAGMTKPLERREAFFTFHLEDYALRLREADEKAKTLPLPSGTVRTTRRQPAVIVREPEQLVKWAQEHDVDALVKVSPASVTDIRSVTVAEEFTKAIRWSVDLSCGHECRSEVAPEEPKVENGAEWWCDECGIASTVVATQQEPVMAWRVVYEGREVPGLDVEPGYLTASAKADL